MILLTLAWQSTASLAQTVPSLQKSLNSYYQNKFGGYPGNERITGFRKVVAACPYRRTCTWTPTIVLAGFREGDGGGEVLFRNTSTCPGCYLVLTAGGGVLGVQDIEKFGIDAVTAKSVVSGK